MGKNNDRLGTSLPYQESRWMCLPCLSLSTESLKFGLACVVTNTAAKVLDHIYCNKSAPLIQVPLPFKEIFLQGLRIPTRSHRRRSPCVSPPPLPWRCSLKSRRRADAFSFALAVPDFDNATRGGMTPSCKTLDLNLLLFVHK